MPDLAAGATRRLWLARVVQTGQVLDHRLMLDRVLSGKRFAAAQPLVSLAKSVLLRFPQLAVIPAYAIGIGVRPEHAPEFARRASAPD
jgi:hypothetical protein